jgi:23S rRNA (uracil1939-C5)-methyltransferase
LEWHYRNVVQAVPGRADHGGAGGSIGSEATRLLCFRRARSHAPVAVEHCYIADPLINRALEAAPWAALGDDTWAALEGVTLRAVPGEAVQITLLASKGIRTAAVSAFVAGARTSLPELVGVLRTRARGDAPHVLWGAGALTYELAGNRFEVPPDAFFQVNLGAAGRLVDLVVEWLAPGPEDDVLDAYAGVGTFTVPLARRCRSVWAVEAHRSAAAAIVDNAVANGATNVSADPRPLEAVLARRRRSVDLVVLDPPRQGCTAEAVAGVADLRPRRVAYVSCEPSTLARDLRRFMEHGYRLTRACVVDLFPQTYHLESLAILERA